MGKKLRFLILTVTQIVIQSTLHIFFDLSNGIFPIILVLVFLVIAWMFLKDLYPKGILIDKYIFISLYAFVSTTFLFYFPTLGHLARFAFILLAGVLSYLLYLAINVYIVSEQHGNKLPLLQPAKVVVLLAFVATLFFGSTMIYKVLLFSEIAPANLVLKYLLFGLLFYLLATKTQWFSAGLEIEQGSSEERNKNSISLIWILLLQLAVVLGFFPFEDLGRGLLVAGSGYILVSFVQVYLQHRIRLANLINFFFLFAVVYLIVIFL